MVNGAAIYLRSSKDRKDVSISAQRRDLEKLAAERGLTITAEFKDIVESGKDEFRPGYQHMCSELANKARGWDTILMLDTARLARRQYIASAFTHMCSKHAVKIIFAKIPDLDPITEVLILGVMRAMDEVHSLVSREKGLTGMAENVRNGFRAGGRAPMGYVLKSVDTGAVREGKPVTKTTLVEGPDAPAMQKFLQARADGTPRSTALKLAGLKIAAATGVGIEWNALTYAGHTVWNVNREVGHPKGRKRPRNEWVIKHNTHPALISDEQAERILGALENNSRAQAISKGLFSASGYLLTGLLRSSTGEELIGMNNRGHRCYRLVGTANKRGKLIDADLVDSSVINGLVGSMETDEFIDALHQASVDRKVDERPRLALEKEWAELGTTVSRAAKAALAMDEPEAMLAQLDSMQRRRKSIRAEIDDLKLEEEALRAGQSISKDMLRDLLGGLADQLRSAPITEVKPVLASFIEKVVLNKSAKSLKLHFKISNRCVDVASPRQINKYAAIKYVHTCFLAA